MATIPKRGKNENVKFTQHAEMLIGAEEQRSQSGMREKRSAWQREAGHVRQGIA